AFRLGNNRPPRSLDLPHRPIAVHRHHQHIGESSRRLEVSQMPDVEDVEDPIGQGDPAPGAPDLVDFLRQPIQQNDVPRGAHPFGCLSSRCNSACETVAVPCFWNTRPPALFARCPALNLVARAPGESASAAITVSPAPVTSTASSGPWIGISSAFPVRSKIAMPLRPRVTNSD